MISQGCKTYRVIALNDYSGFDLYLGLEKRKFNGLEMLLQKQLE